MSDSILDLVTQSLGAGGTRQIGQQLGLDEGSAAKAISGALPVLMGALARNSNSSSGAGALAGALDRDHDGSILDDIGGFLGGGGAESAGAGILKHVLGGRQPQVQAGLGQASGLDAGKAGQLLSMLAPIVMGALGKAQRGRGLDAGGLGAMLGQEQRRIERREPQLGGMLGSLLDADGDGSVMDDITKIGGSLLGGLLSGRR
ncbi:MAG: DUF937 domain-containing protein [Acidobacteriota bacterium]